MDRSKVISIPLFERVFYFLRHGETEFNRLKLIAGSTDVELNDTGRAQAQAAVELVRPLGISHIVSSGLRRARDTAATVAAALGIPHTMVAGLAERNWGALEAKPQTLRGPGETPPGGETVDQFVSRTRAALAEIAAGGTPLIVAHSGTFRVLCRLLALDAGEPISNCHPVRFTPPQRAGAGWSMTLL
ncbi:MAG: histidine phosphatase family protein [Burkholderiales bacterium]